MPGGAVGGYTGGYGGGTTRSSGPGGAGGVRRDSYGGTRQSATSANVGSNRASSNTGRDGGMRDSTGSGGGTGAGSGNAGAQSGQSGGFQRSGLNNALSGLNRADRGLVEAGTRIGRDYGLGTARGILAAHELNRTAFGELGRSFATPANLAAIERVGLNRLGLMSNYGRYRGTPQGVFAGFDANGLGYGFGRGKALAAAGVSPTGNAAYQSATFGSPEYQSALNALTGQLNGTGPQLPDFVQNATNYHNPEISHPSWGRDAQRFGPHAFNSPDPGFGPTQVAASNAKISNGIQPDLPETAVASVERAQAPIPRDKPAVPDSFAMNQARPVSSIPQPNEVLQADASRRTVSPALATAMQYVGMRPVAEPPAKITDRIAPESIFASRPSVIGSFPAAQPPKDQSRIAASEPEPKYQDRIAPEQPQLAELGLPRDPFDTGRGILTGRPASQFASTFPSRPERVGSLPAAQPQLASAAPEPQQAVGGGWFDDVVNRTKNVVAGVPDMIRNKVMEDPNDPAAAVLGGWSHPIGQQNPLRDEKDNRRRRLVRAILAHRAQTNLAYA